MLSGVTAGQSYSLADFKDQLQSAGAVSVEFYNQTADVTKDTIFVLVDPEPKKKSKKSKKADADEPKKSLTWGAALDMFAKLRSSKYLEIVWRVRRGFMPTSTSTSASSSQALPRLAFCFALPDCRLHSKKGVVTAIPVRPCLFLRDDIKMKEGEAAKIC